MTPWQWESIQIRGTVCSSLVPSGILGTFVYCHICLAYPGSTKICVKLLCGNVCCKKYYRKKKAELSWICLPHLLKTHNERSTENAPHFSHIPPIQCSLKSADNGSACHSHAVKWSFYTYENDVNMWYLLWFSKLLFQFIWLNKNWAHDVSHSINHSHLLKI